MLVRGSPEGAGGLSAGSLGTTLRSWGVPALIMSAIEGIAAWGFGLGGPEAEGIAGGGLGPPAGGGGGGGGGPPVGGGGGGPPVGGPDWERGGGGAE